MNENWRPVEGYEGSYSVSDLGRVRSEWRKVMGRWGEVWVGGIMLRPASTDAGGHVGVALYRESKRREARVHRLVLEAFVGPCPKGMEGCHDDGDPANNRLTNLRWDTKAANVGDRLRHGTDHGRRKTHCLYEHLLALPNLIPANLKGGRRACLACARGRNSVPHLPGDNAEWRPAADRHYALIMGHG